MMTNYPYRIIKARWSNAEAHVDFNVGVRVVGNDEVSIVSNITDILSKDSEVKLRGINLNSKDGNFEGMLTLSIRDIYHLDKVIAKIMAIRGVHSAERFDVRS